MTNTETPKPTRRRSGGLGGLLTGAAPAGDETAPRGREWVAVNDSTGEVLMRIRATTLAKASAAVTEELGQVQGISVIRADQAPASPPARPVDRSGGLLPRAPRGGGRRRSRPTTGKLTMNINEALLNALEDLSQRDETHKYEEVEEALRTHLQAKGIEIAEER